MLTVYTKNSCPFCVKAKDYLDIKGIDYEEKNIESDPSAREFVKSRGHTTVPQLYKDGEIFVEGGCNGLLNLSEDELMNRLEA